MRHKRGYRMRPGWNDEHFLNSSCYYHWPAIWVEASPVSDGKVDARKLGETVCRKILDSGVEIRVCRDGMFAFRFSDWSGGRYPTFSERVRMEFDEEEMRAQRIRLLNAHLACLYTVLWQRQDSTLKRMIISPDEVIPMKLIDDDSETITSDERFYSMLDARNPASVKHWSPPVDLDWRFRRGMVIEVGTIEESLALLDRVLCYPDEEPLVLTALYARAAKHYEERNHDICLITAWAVVERLLNRLQGTHTKVRTPMAGELINKLSASGKLSPRLREEAFIVHDARSGWIHRLVPVTKENSGKAIRAAEAMLKLCLDLQLAVPLYPGERYEEGDV